MNKNRYSFRCSDDQLDTSIEIDLTTDKVLDIVDYLNRFLIACGHSTLKVVDKSAESKVNFSISDNLFTSPLENITFVSTNDTITLSS